MTGKFLTTLTSYANVMNAPPPIIIPRQALAPLQKDEKPRTLLELGEEYKPTASWRDVKPVKDASTLPVVVLALTKERKGLANFRTNMVRELLIPVSLAGTASH